MFRYANIILPKPLFDGGGVICYDVCQLWREGYHADPIGPNSTEENKFYGFGYGWSSIARMFFCGRFLFLGTGSRWRIGRTENWQRRRFEEAAFFN